MKSTGIWIRGIGAGALAIGVVYLVLKGSGGDEHAELITRLREQVESLQWENDRLRIEADRARKQLRASTETPKDAVPATPPAEAPPSDKPKEPVPALLALAKEFDSIGSGIFTEPNEGKLLSLVSQAQQIGKPAMDYLHDRLARGGAAERLTALLVLKGVSSPDSVLALEQTLLTDPDVMIRRMSVFTLNQVAAGTPEATRVTGSFLKVMESDDDWRVRANAAFMVAQTGDARGVNALIDGYNNAPAEIRIGYLEAMAATRNPTFAPTLHQVLSTESNEMMLVMAIEGVKNLGNADALPLLRKVASEPKYTSMVKQYAANAIQVLSKE